ncbi:hypothetical protein FVEN_g4628 [Fusarium venenatum]|nr:hypothetical protein FVEN_g4628 [Fusarium venenatum]
MEGGLIVSPPLFAGKGLGTSIRSTLFPFSTSEEALVSLCIATPAQKRTDGPVSSEMTAALRLPHQIYLYTYSCT